MTDPELDPVVAEYSNLADRYDHRWSFYIKSTVRETLRRLRIETNDAVLDIGCGTGSLLHALARSAHHVRLAGVDPTPDMLDIARTKLGTRADLRVGWAEQLPFDDDEFSVVVSTSTFHYIRKPDKALAEIARVLKPGGRAVITDWCDDYLACRVCDLFLKLFNRAHFRTYGRKECQQLLESSHLENVGVERYRLNWLWGIMTAIGHKSQSDVTLSRSEQPCQAGEP